jgi:hypothetical protein
VQKLKGGKRRARELENGARAVTANKDEQGEEQDSAEESRAAGIALRKRQRVDPFEPGGKKKKKKMKKAVGLVVGGGSVEATAQAKEDIEMEEAPRSGSMATEDAMTRPGPKKKKKRKRHLPESQGAQGHVARGGPGGEARSARLDADITQHAEPSTQSSLLEEWDGISQDQQGSRSGTPGPSCSGMFFFSFSTLLRGCERFFSADHCNFESL